MVVIVLGEAEAAMMMDGSRDTPILLEGYCVIYN